MRLLCAKLETDLMKMPCLTLRYSGLGNDDEEKKNNGTHGYFAFDKAKVGQR